MGGHLHDEQWREVFLLTAGLMREADDLLVAMEAEAAKSINTPRLNRCSDGQNGLRTPQVIGTAELPNDHL